MKSLADRSDKADFLFRMRKIKEDRRRTGWRSLNLRSERLEYFISIFQIASNAFDVQTECTYVYWKKGVMLI